MGILDQARQAARQAHDDHAQLRQRWEELGQRLLGARPRAAEKAPTLTVDEHGHARPDVSPNGLRVLGQSLLLAASSLLAAGLSWLATFFLGLYLFLQRVMGLRVSTAA